MKKKTNKKKTTRKKAAKKGSSTKKSAKRKPKLHPYWSRTLIIKRRGQDESFDERKIYASCFHAIRMADVSRKDSEVICEKIMLEMKKWLKHKKKITSKQLFIHAIKILKKHDKDAAYLYESLRDIN